VLEAVGSGERDVPSYIDADHKKMSATFLRAPGLGDVPYPVQMNPAMVVEFYSR
jgi:small subunit ribosomal protein S4